MNVAPTTPSAGRPRVLVADDHPAVRAVVRDLLARDFEVVGDAADGEEALRLARALVPDVLVLDVDMPGLDGFVVASRLRAGGTRVAIVFLSVHGGEDYAQEAAASGGLAYVRKVDLHRDLGPAVRAAAAGRPNPPPDAGPGAVA